MILKINTLPPTDSTLEKYIVTEEDKLKYKEYDFSTPPTLNNISESNSNSDSDTNSESDNKLNNKKLNKNSKRVYETDTLIYNIVNSEEDFIEIMKVKNKDLNKNKELKLKKFTDLLIYDSITDGVSFQLNNNIYLALSLETNISIFDVFIYNSLEPQIIIEEPKINNLNLLNNNLFCTTDIFLFNYDLFSLKKVNEINIINDNNNKITGIYSNENKSINEIYLTTESNLYLFDLRVKNNNNLFINKPSISKIEFSNKTISNNKDLIFIGDEFGNLSLFDSRYLNKNIKNINICKKPISNLEFYNEILVVSSLDKNININNINVLNKDLDLLGGLRNFEPVTAFKVLDFNKNLNEVDLVVGGIKDDVYLRRVSF
ncbi:hypothetical protein CDIK_2675 [Cucumispora dikerogammari]|nr:hypothetical protein CDIK_2675 [Cucumispora dikerogammari]